MSIATTDTTKVAEALTAAPGSQTKSIAAILVIVQTLAVWYTTGFVWTLQLMDYPMVAKLKDGPEYMALHNQMFWAVLGPGLAVAGVTAIVALFARPLGIPLWAAITSVVLGIGIILLSGRVATPDRDSLAQTFTLSVHQHLIMVSWIRTLAFTAWGVLDGFLIWKVVRGGR